MVGRLRSFNLYNNHVDIFSAMGDWWFVTETRFPALKSRLAAMAILSRRTQLSEYPQMICQSKSEKCSRLFRKYWVVTHDIIDKRPIIMWYRWSQDSSSHWWNLIITMPADDLAIHAATKLTSCDLMCLITFYWLYILSNSVETKQTELFNMVVGVSPAFDTKNRILPLHSHHRPVIFCTDGVALSI